ncbi:MAG: hypothetical protein SWY16_23985 [Cyanobacteriota bacterium]|nr:hypothetical protein [Cyanobacteriota bacterium]
MTLHLGFLNLIFTQLVGFASFDCDRNDSKVSIRLPPSPSDRP